MKFFAFAAVSAIAVAAASPAAAAVVTSLPGGTAVAIPGTNQLGTSDTQVIAAGITADPGTTFAFGYSGSYGFGNNPSWSGVSMIGLDLGTGSFDIVFANAITGFLSEVNWSTTDSVLNATMAAYDSAGRLLETLTLEAGGVNQVTPGFHGFSRATADIGRIRYSNEYIGIRNITITGNPAAAAAVPEPATWGLMLAGFGLVGAGMRTRRRSVAFAA